MTSRKYCLSNITQEQLEEIAAKYPKAVMTVRKPVYKVVAMLMECGIDVPGVEANPELPPLLRTKG